jgi:tetratricopeptide (TPR) repeat protein
MKNKYIITVALAALSGLTSCNKFLDRLPDQRLEVDTPEKVAMLLTSAYTREMPVALLELASDNITDNGVGYGIRYDLVPESYLYKDHTTTVQDTPHRVWEYCYKAITTANSALEAAEKLEAEGHDMSAHKAEALITRAWHHFLLVNTFCLAYNPVTSATDAGIPYMTEPVKDVFARFGRGNVKEVWDKMNADIEAALPYIDDNLYNVPKNHFNRKAAYCFAAEFNLYYGNYDKAVEYANVVLGSKPAELMRDMAAMEAQATSDNAGMEYRRPDLPCNLMLLSTYSRWGRIYASTAYPRYAHNTAMTNISTFQSPGPWSGKIGRDFRTSGLALNELYHGGDAIEYYPKMKSIEEASGEGSVHVYAVWVPFTTEKALLTRAEAYVMQERYDAAADDLVLWYNAHHDSEIVLSADDICEFYRGETYVEEEGGDEKYTGAILGNTKFVLNPKITITDGMQNEMIQAVLHARRIEFMHEGWRLLDLKRFGIAFTHYVDRGTNIEIGPWDKRLAIQLPFMVISAGMEPNPR